MATELRPGGTTFLSFQNVLGHGINPTRKSEEEVQVRSLDADGERMAPRVIQVGTIGEFLGWMAPQEMIQGSEEGLAQRWETQWQEVLKAVQRLPPGFATPHQSKPFPWDSCESVPNTSQWLNGESVPQFLIVNNGELPPQILYGPEMEGNRLMKDVLVDQEALLTEAQRQRFRQYSYQEAEEPQEVCKRLQEFCCQWLMPEKHSKEQILELVILEQFLAILPPEMQGWVRDRYPQACSQAVSLAEEFLRSQKQEIKVLEPCTAVMMISPEAEGSLATSGSNGLFCGEAELKGGQDPSLVGEPTMGISQLRDPELPVLFGSMGQPGSLERRVGLVQKSPMELSQKGDGARLCSEGVYETVVRLEEHGHWCLECGESFQDALQLQDHQNLHSNRKRPECPECGKSFRDLSHVLRHQTVHTGEKPYACFKCGQSFTQKPALNRHLRKHLESQDDSGDQEQHGNQENSYWVGPTPSWAWSNQTFPENRVGPFASNLGQRPLMNQHPKAASGADREGKTARKTISRRGLKKYWCFVCFKGFRDKADLVRHDRIHTGEKPYSCLDCGRKFSYTSSLYKHQLIHRRAGSLKGNQFREMSADYDPDGFSTIRTAPSACLEGGGGWRNGVKLEPTEEKPTTLDALSVGKAHTQSSDFIFEVSAT